MHNDNTIFQDYLIACGMVAARRSYVAEHLRLSTISLHFMALDVVEATVAEMLPDMGREPTLAEYGMLCDAALAGLRMRD
jgi:ATP-dependent RNA circularization protein (DNA/RNA ligase family)